MKLGSFGVGFSLGFGTGLLIREILPIVREIMTPVVRLSVKGGIRFFEKSREATMKIGEGIEDLIAEVQSELKQSRVKAERRSPKTKRKGKQPIAVEIPPELREVA